MDIQEQAKIMRREGKILERFDKEDENGYHSGFFIEWQGYEYMLRMTNGEVKRLKRMWKIEEEI